MKFNRYLLFILAVIVLLLSSCTSRKKTLYFQNKDNDSTLTFNSYVDEHKIVNGDVLYINFYSLNKPLSDVFNRQQSTSNSYSMWNSEANVYVNGFSVNDSGFVELPLIGYIYIANQTIEEAKNLIQEKAQQYINDVTVIVKLLNYRFTVIGEVSRPGTYTNYNDNLTIYQALAKAGDVTIYGNKINTKIIRQTKEGKIIISFDLTSINVLSSDIYYIKPNDIIYIEPIRNKSFRQNLPNIALLFSSISTTILVLSFMGK